MRTKETVDYFYVRPEHKDIHARLLNWARWVRVRPHGWQTHPMWRKVITSKQWDVDPHVPVPVDILDAAFLEKAVFFLPNKNRDAIRWSYVHKRDPLGMARFLAVTKQELADLVDNGRTMLMNRLQS